MSEKTPSQNTPLDPLAPEVPAQAKKPETPTTRVEQKMAQAVNEITEFKKDVKFLWIYASVFCLVLLALIGGSYVIQEKIHQQVDDYKTQAQDAAQSDAENKSRLSNIQEQNKALKAQVQSLTDENNTLKAGAANDEALITKREQMLQQQERLIEAISLYEQNKWSKAREALKSIDPQYLSAESAEIYTYYEERLN